MSLSKSEPCSSCHTFIQSCPLCDKPMCNQTCTNQCQVCEVLVCRSCSEKCPRPKCKSFICEKCKWEKCLTCSVRVCKGCFKECPHCYKKMCAFCRNDCSHKIDCDGPDCKKSITCERYNLKGCEKCKNVFCRTCAMVYECDNCRSFVCPCACDGKISTCHACEAKYCKGCTTKYYKDCLECGETVCSNCRETYYDATKHDVCVDCVCTKCNPVSSTMSGGEKRKAEKGVTRSGGEKRKL